MIDIIIPTMWAVDDFVDVLEYYTECELINKIIIIDNNRKARPKNLPTSKLEIVSFASNIYVNKAWNEGVWHTTTEIIGIINDDIRVDHSVFQMVLDHNLTHGDIVGVDLRGYADNYKIDDHIETNEEIVRLDYNPSKAIGGQAWAFGICMFMLRESYKKIPSLYQVWYGDEYLVQRAKNVYAIRSNKIKGRISETIKSQENPNSDIMKRIELDTKNSVRLNHFSHKSDISMNRTSDNVFEAEYQRAKNTPSDINENLHILYELAQQCDSVTEMGVRTGVSTRAFLNTDTKLVSYDIQHNEQVARLFDVAKQYGKQVDYVIADVTKIEIAETDLLFIDTFHVYEQLKKELQLHGNRAMKYIVFHDTHTFGTRGEANRDTEGLLPAIIEFILSNPHWKFNLYTTSNNGLTVLKRETE